MQHHLTTDLLTELNAARTLEDLWAATAAYLDQLGLSCSIYTFVKPGRHDKPRFWTSLPAFWQDRYVDRNYARVDPFFRHCCNTFEPIGTGPEYLADHPFLTKAERQFIHEGAVTGFRSGFSAPVGLVGGAGFGGWNFGSLMSRRELESILAERGRDLRLIAFYVHHFAEQLDSGVDGTDERPYAPLTDREKECLLWLGRGLRTDAIADRLGIASVTVDLHFKGARRKLGAVTREEALAKAIAANLISP